MDVLSIIFDRIIQLSLIGSFAIVCVLLVRQLFKLMRVPKRFVLFLWIIPFIRLALPIDVVSEFSIIPREILEMGADTRPVEKHEYEYLGYDEAIEGAHQQSEITDSEIDNKADEEVNQGPANSSNAIVHNNLDAVNQSSSITGIKDGDVINKGDKSYSTRDYIAIVWSIGIIVLLGISVGLYIRLLLKLRFKAHKCENIYQVDYIDTAIVIGGFKPYICVSSNTSDEELKHVVAHERVHISYRDYITKTVFFLITILHWYNPLVWLGYYMMEKDMEMACDEGALKLLGEDNLSDYANTLLKLSVDKNQLFSFPIAFGEGTTKGRIKHIMKRKKPVAALLVVAVLVILCLVVVVLTNPVVKTTDDKTSGSTEVIDATDEATDKENTVVDPEGIIKPGTYTMIVNDSSNTISPDELTGGFRGIFIPQLTIGEGGDISFFYDPLSSYYNYSYKGYQVEDGKLTFTTDDGNRTFTFDILDDGYLAFDKENSFSVLPIDGNSSVKVEDGSLFVLDDKSYIENGVTYCYNIQYSEPIITPEHMLGADGVKLDYSDGEKLIFHGDAGLFVYNLNAEEMIISVDLAEIGCDKTQGDEAHMVRVSDDGSLVYIVPVNQSGFESVLEIYTTGTYNPGDLDTENLSLGYNPSDSTYGGAKAYVLDIESGKLTAGPVSHIYKEDELSLNQGLEDSGIYVDESYRGNGFVSYHCAKIVDEAKGKTVYGFLFCETGLWQDIRYFQDNEIYYIFPR